jgi:hypothetical protein
MGALYSAQKRLDETCSVALTSLNLKLGDQLGERCLKLGNIFIYECVQIKVVSGYLLDYCRSVHGLMVGGCENLASRNHGEVNDQPTNNFLRFFLYGCG